MTKQRVYVAYDETNEEWNIFTEGGRWFFAEDSEGFKTKKDAMKVITDNPEIFTLVEPK